MIRLIVIRSTFLSCLWWLVTISAGSGPDPKPTDREREELQTLYDRIFSVYPKNPELALPNIRKAHAICRRAPYELSDGMIITYALLAECSSSLEVMDTLLQAAEIFVQHNDTDLYKPFKARLVYVRGVYYFRSGNFDQAYAAFLQYIQTIDPVPTAWDYPYQAYSYLGFINVVKGNYQKAVEFFEHSKKYIRDEDTRFEAGHHYLMLGQTVLQLGDGSSAERYLNEAVRLFKQLPADHKKGRHYLARSWLALSEYYRAHHQLEKASLALKALQTIPASDYKALAVDVELELARISLDQGQPQAALQYCMAGLRLADSIYGPCTKHYKKGLLWTIIGDVNAKSQPIRSALSVYQQAMVHFVPGFLHEKDVTKNPDIQMASARKELLYLLGAKARLLFAEAKGRPDCPVDVLSSCFETYEQALQLVQLIRNDYRDDDAKAFLAQTSFPLFEEAFDVTYRLYICTGDEKLLERALQIAEKSKAASLFESLQSLKAFQRASIPADTQALEIELKSKIAFYERRILELSNQSPVDSNAWLMDKDALFQVRQANEKLLVSLERDHQAYFNLKYQLTPPTLGEIATSLGQIKAEVLEYFWSKDDLYCFHLSAAKSTLRKIELGSTDRQLLDSLLDQTHQPQYTVHDIRRFATQSNAVYRLLQVDKATVTDRLVIIPDGNLSRLPFGALNTTAITGPKFQVGYLENQKIISLAPSISIWKQTLETPLVQSDLVRALAPIRFESHGLTNLEESYAHLSTLSQLLSGQPLILKAASKDSLLNAIAPDKSCNLLVLCTHATADQIPRIYLYDAPLYLEELYNQTIHANLVVLSSCETGRGRWAKGEGVMSLERGFAYAGVPSIVSTLWSVNEKTTREILEEFYKNLAAGKPKDEALTLAKRKFLVTQRSSPVEYTPFFWAGITLYGNPTPIFDTKDKLLTPSYIAGLFIFMFLLGLWAKKIWKSSFA